MYLLIKGHKMPVKKAFWFHQRLIGLMFQKKLKYAMLFRHTNSVHTFFMKVNIDIVGINNENVVIFKAVNIPKNQIVTIKNSIKNTSILEMPKDTSRLISIGDKLTFVSED